MTGGRSELGALPYHKLQDTVVLGVGVGVYQEEA